MGGRLERAPRQENTSIMMSKVKPSLARDRERLRYVSASHDSEPEREAGEGLAHRLDAHALGRIDARRGRRSIVRMTLSHAKPCNA